MNENKCEIRAEILLASYNGAKYIREQIDSILNQKDDRWHLTVSDDGSTDETREILDDCVRRYPQKIRRIESGRRFGNARDHFFWLIGQCDADYMLTCDQDDRWYDDKLGKTLDALLDAVCVLTEFDDYRQHGTNHVWVETYVLGCIKSWVTFFSLADQWCWDIRLDNEL